LAKKEVELLLGTFRTAVYLVLRRWESDQMSREIRDEAEDGNDLDGLAVAYGDPSEGVIWTPEALPPVGS
jgi:hypothetical protein